MATIQYYFSQSANVAAFKAPTTKMFDTQSYLVWNRTFVDLAINKTSNLSQFMKDYLTYKHWFISGSNDFISYKNSIKFWLENELSFVERDAFKAAKLDVTFILIRRILSSVDKLWGMENKSSKSSILNC